MDGSPRHNKCPHRFFEISRPTLPKKKLGINFERSLNSRRRRFFWSNVDIFIKRQVTWVDKFLKSGEKSNIAQTRNNSYFARDEKFNKSRAGYIYTENHPSCWITFMPRIFCKVETSELVFFLNKTHFVVLTNQLKREKNGLHARPLPQGISCSVFMTSAGILNRSVIKDSDILLVVKWNETSKPSTKKPRICIV